ncbi:MAG: hypothetical protein EVG15_06940 [Candidatus Acididesulfobacter diazotrophicus]|uniref:Uncharacterized protein n=1 Tax=Candidatus Acididesulfobacter diazotrophicus TaxID=2597226 RepID=A0A519BLN2_9DELT|nr:MAG: hypothetical protein EVG15_06940 [Candidatus Acididesulfobacter diazotrophicus]
MINKENRIQTTKNECRTCFWAPLTRTPNQVLKGIGRSFIIDISGLKILIETNITLTQAHRDIIYAIFIFNYKRSFTKSGDFRALFSISSIYNALNRRYSKETIIEKLKELFITKFFASPVDDKKIFTPFQYVNEFKPSNIKINDDRLDRLNIEKYYYLIEISRTYFEFQNYDLKILIDDEIVKKIIKLESAILKDLIYYTLSHNVLNKDLQAILYEKSILTQTTTKQRKSAILKEIINRKDILVSEFKIEIKKMESGRYGVFHL